MGGALGGWRGGNTIDGVQAEYFRVPFAQANLALIPDDLDDEDVILLADIASTGFSAAESGKIRLGDTVAVFCARAYRTLCHSGSAIDGRFRNLRRRF